MASTETTSHGSVTACVALILSILTAMGPQLTARTVVNGAFPYNTASVPFLAEIIKFVASLLFLFVSWRPGVQVQTFTARHAVMYAPPALLYWMSNNAGLRSCQHLDPATVQLLSNVRTTITALLLWSCLKRAFTRLQWLAIFLLPLSMMLSQIDMAKLSVEGLSLDSSQVQGYILIAVSACSSSIAVVYTEWALKSHKAPIHAQNAQLYVWGIFVNLLYYLSRDPTGRSMVTLTNGFSTLTWMCVLHLSCCGMVVSWILKFADAIVKAYATSGAVVLSSLCSILLFGKPLEAPLAVGTAMACLSIVLFYGTAKSLQKPKPKEAGHPASEPATPHAV